MGHAPDRKTRAESRRGQSLYDQKNTGGRTLSQLQTPDHQEKEVIA